ncbi:MAG: TetR/AcrR family transcriptional regulator, partial [Marmoricola sp.]
MPADADGRRARGDATRARVAAEAAQIATVQGLDAITVGTLATETGVSKSGILTVFETREAIQLAAVAGARRLYIEHVIGPAWSERSGKPRLRALVSHWIEYLRAGVFRGG